MSESVRYAILDTDFVSKANIIKSNNRVLADEVLKFPGYRFYCHQKMKTELGDHGTRSAQAWLDQKIASGDIRCYDDEQIIKELREAAGNHCYAYYQSYLVEGCSGIRFVTPASRHTGEDVQILANRHAVYEAAKEAHPERWNGRQTRDWSYIPEVYLNPDRQYIESDIGSYILPNKFVS